MSKKSPKKSGVDGKPKPEEAGTQGTHGFLVVGIGASAGGIRALTEFFSLMPDDSGVVFVVILHLSQEHESSLHDIIQRHTKMAVAQVTETLTVRPNHVYVIPPAKPADILSPPRTAGPRHPRARRKGPSPKAGRRTSGGMCGRTARGFTARGWCSRSATRPGSRSGSSRSCAT